MKQKHHFLWAVVMAMLYFLMPCHAMAQNHEITLSYQDESLPTVFKRLESVSGYKISFSYDDVSQYRASGKLEKASIIEAMNHIIGDKPLGYTVDGLTVKVVRAQRDDKVLPTVKGRVVMDDDGSAVMGATVVIDGTNQGVATDIDGKFVLQEVPKSAYIKISYIGATTVRLKVAAMMNVRLKSDELSLKNVVVTGYYTQRKQTFTGAVTSFSGSELRSVSDQNVLSTVAALDPSFNLTENLSMGSDPNNIPDIQVRGVNSLPNTDANLLNEQYKGKANLPTFILDGFEVSVEKIYDLDPNRVSNISILKDASATAIYGSRASNGVVIIDTKAPTPGQLKLNYTGSVDFEIADLSNYSLLNAREKLKYEDMAGLYYGSKAIYVKEDYLETYNERLKLVTKGYDTDWLSKPLRSVGITNRHSAQLEGGSDNFRYGVNFTYNNTAGVMKGSGRTRIGTGIKLQYNYKNLRFRDEITYDNVSSTQSPYGSFRTYTNLNPYYYPYDELGKLKKILFVNNTATGSSQIVNPMYNTTLNAYDKTVYDDFVNNFSVEWDIMRGLKLKGNFSLERINRNMDVFKSADHTDFINVKENKGSYTKGNRVTNNYDGNIILSYFTTLKEKHAVSFNGGWNIQETNDDYNSYTVYGFANQALDHPSLGANFKEGDHVRGYATKTRLMGFLLNTNYSYDDRYFVDASIRADGSSIFGSNKRWGAFWSSGIGWNLHKERFMEGNKMINQLRFKLSTGFTGNQNFYPYQSMMMYQYMSALSYQDYIGAIIKAYGNDNLKWQRTQKNNFGIDFELFNHYVSGYFNYFVENSKDLLVDVTMANYLGFEAYKENLGETQNRGFEFNVKASVIRTKDFRLNLFANGMHYKNKLRKISSGLSSYNAHADADASSKPYVRYVEGASINSIWVVPSAGIDPATGNEIFIKKDGSYTNAWSEKDYVPYKSTDPKLVGTFGLNAYYKGWELNSIFYYRFGGYAYNQTLVDKVENVNPYLNVDRRALYNRWSTPGVSAKFKRINDLTTTKPTSRFVEKDNLLRGTSLSIAYTFNRNWIKIFGAQYLKLMFTANDFLYTSSIHREMGTAYPYAHHYALSAQLTF